MLTRTRALRLAVVTAGLAGLATACSSPSPQPSAPGRTTEAEPTATATTAPSPQTWNGLTGAEIITQASEALEEAPSYRLEGELAEGSGLITLDLVYAEDDSRGTWSSGTASAEVIRVDGVTYVKGNAAYWERVVYEETAAALAGDWVELDGPYRTLGASLAPDVTTLLTPAGVLQPDDESTVDGQPALTLTDGVLTVTVAADDPRYPLRIATDDGTDLALTDFGAPVTVEAPTGDVLSLAAFTGN